jgi:prostaglandin-H2 D-isomerase / glutathione transferase
MTGGSQPKLKLYYFNIPGKGEPIRLLCVYGGLDLEDYRMQSSDEFLQLKAEGKLAFGQVPMLEVVQEVQVEVEEENGNTKKVVHHHHHQLVQSTAILRYLGKLSGLYPKDDDILAAKIDAAMAQETDAFMGPVVATYTKRFGICLEGEQAMTQSKELIANEVIPRHLAALEKLLAMSETGWIAGTEKPSPADFVWYVQLAMYMPGKPEFFPEKLCTFQDYPRIKAFVNKFSALPTIQDYYAKKQDV